MKSENNYYKNLSIIFISIIGIVFFLTIFMPDKNKSL